MASGSFLMIVSACLSALGLPTPSFQGLGDLNGGQFSSNAYGVSADGQTVVGQSSSSSGNHAFTWTEANGMIGLPDFAGGAFDCAAHAVSAYGDYFGGWGTNSAGRNAATWVPNSNPVNRGDLAGGPTNARILAVPAFNGTDIVGVGDGFDANGRKALLFSSTSGPLTLGDLNPGDLSVARGVSGDASIIVGDSEALDHSRIEAFRWTQAGGIVGLGDLDGGGFRSSAIAISTDSSVIVGYGQSVFGTEAMLWTASEGMVGLGDLPGGVYSSYANATSGDGSTIVGVGSDSTGNAAFIWSAADGLRSLRTVLVDDLGLDLADWTLTAATGISEDGLIIVGTGTNPDGQTEAWIAHIPEPSTLSLLFAGFAILVARTRRS